MIKSILVMNPKLKDHSERIGYKDYKSQIKILVDDMPSKEICNLILTNTSKKLTIGNETFELDKDPLRAPGILDVDGRYYELIFVGRSGQSFPAAIEIAALVEGLEPMETEQTDTDLWKIMEWLVQGVGGRWTIEALRTAGKIYRVMPEGSE